jgi:hypothetical protein
MNNRERSVERFGEVLVVKRSGRTIRVPVVDGELLKMIGEVPESNPEQLNEPPSGG